MFSFVNRACLGTGMRGNRTVELALQNSTPYKRERMTMPALSGTEEKDKVGERIMNHPGVRRMLLTHKMFVEGRLALFDRVGKMLDQFQQAPD